MLVLSAASKAALDVVNRHRPLSKLCSHIVLTEVRD